MQGFPTLIAVLCAHMVTGCSEPGRALPRTFQLGALPDSLRPLLAEDCDSTREHHYTGTAAAPFVDQVQVDCQGLEVFGAQRTVEFLFNDGPLGHLWVLIDSTDIPGIDSALTSAFGPVVHRTPEYLVYRAGTVALRFTPPEVLVATPALINELTGYRPSGE